VAIMAIKNLKERWAALPIFLAHLPAAARES